MDLQRPEFLKSMIEILERLNQTCVQRGEPLLASVLAIAKGEAEDALRHADELATLNALRKRMSSQNNWRPEDTLPAERDMVSLAEDEARGRGGIAA